MAEKAKPVTSGWDLKRGYDAAAKWTPVPDWNRAAIVRSSWAARPVFGLHQLLLSGDLEGAHAALAPEAAMLGLWEIGEGDAMVRIARDRALLVTALPVDFQPGWNPGGRAASPACDAWAVFELSGESARAVCAQATSADLDAGSRSASLLFAGTACLLYRTAPEIARIHVERGFAPYIWRWLETLEG